MTKRRPFRYTMFLRLLVTFGTLLIIMALLLYGIFTNVSRDALWTQTGQHVITVMEMSDDQITARMNGLSQFMLDIMVNSEMYENMAFLKEGGLKAYSVVYQDVCSEIAFSLYDYGEVASAQIMYNRYVFAYQPRAMGVTTAFTTLPAWECIQAGRGSPVWLSPDEVPASAMQDAKDGSFVWLARVLNMTDIKLIRQAFHKDVAKPVMLIAMDPVALCAPIVKNVDIDGAQCFLLNENGDAFHSLPTPYEDVVPALGEAIRATGGSGMWDDGDNLYFYVKSGLHGWYYVLGIMHNALTGSMISDMARYVLTITLLVLGGMMVVVALFSQSVTRPISKLVTAARQMENGDFGHMIEYKNSMEIGYLVRCFNRMNASIQRLIKENYQARLQEKDAEIMSLTIQFNPHYLYNTLNAIHWVALRGDAHEAAEMIRALSLMMRYTSDHKRECTCLRDDVEWMKRYIYLMEARYADLFAVEWDIDEGVMDMLIPKLFLQPLVENSITHGFTGIDTGGLIRIEGRDEGDHLEFVVTDNGCGMTREQIDSCLADENAPHIGLANVSRRVRLICGEGYGMSIQSDPGVGTRITLKLSKINKTK